MYSPYGSSNGIRRFRGLSIAISVHVLLAAALIFGTSQKSLLLLTKPLQAVVIQDVAIEPPPKPKVVVPPKAPLQKVQPPPFIPTPEVQPTAASFSVESTIVAHELPQPIQAAPPQPPAPSPTPPTPIAKLDISIVCPTQVRPDMPRKALIDGTQGIVKVQVKISGGTVRDVIFVSGPRVFYDAVRSAVMQYKCTQESSEVVATQDFNFRVQP
jgi:protein TonB